MSQINDGLRSILSVPGIYCLFSRLVGDHRCRTVFVSEYLRPAPGNSILDIGCGPAQILAYLPDVHYIGYDASEQYIRLAQERFGGRGTFYNKPIEQMPENSPQAFDLAIAFGVLHHLDDQAALHLFSVAQRQLRTNGRLVTIDGVYTTDQSRIARKILAGDRGCHIRTEAQYVHLATRSFRHVKVDIRTDLLRIPYTHLIMECTCQT